VSAPERSTWIASAGKPKKKNHLSKHRVAIDHRKDTRLTLARIPLPSLSLSLSSFPLSSILSPLIVILQTAALTLAGALSLGTQQASAASVVNEYTQVAGLDSRALVFLLILGPAIGWVAFNILTPGLNQLNDMQVKNDKLKKGVPLGLSLSAAALAGMPEQADAATELMQTAGLDARILIFGAFVPVLGWVGYNILKPGLAQIEGMQVKNAKKR
jgi:hypothetical protein